MENCGLYIAKVVGTSKQNDSRLQVQIIPYMEKISTDLCPKWPFFFKDELYSGKEGDIVWCISNDDFSTGYVLGIANFNTNVSETFEKAIHPYTKKEIPLSPSHSSFEDGEGSLQKVAVSLSGHTLSFSDLKALYWDSNCIHFIDRNSGSFILAFSYGSLMIMSSSLFAIHIGPDGSGPSFKMDSSGVSIIGSDIKLQADHVGLGNNPSGGVLVTQGVDGAAAYVSKVVEA